MTRDPALVSVEAPRLVVAEVGYAMGTLGASRADAAKRTADPVWSSALGLLAMLGLLGLYLGLVTLAQGWDHALGLLFEDRFFVGALSLGFGTQVALFAYLRGLHSRASTGGLAASTGTSTSAMLACCAHHLAEVLPVLGLSGAAAFLGAYKTELLWVGLAMNLAGIAYVLLQIRRAAEMTCSGTLRRHAASEGGPLGDVR